MFGCVTIVPVLILSTSIWPVQPINLAAATVDAIESRALAHMGRVKSFRSHLMLGKSVEYCERGTRLCGCVTPFFSGNSTLTCVHAKNPVVFQYVYDSSSRTTYRYLL
jgi:hypothetical protein